MCSPLLIACLATFLVVDGQRTAVCVANNNGGGCAALKYPVGQVPAGGTQELFGVASGLFLGQYPFAAVGYAKRPAATASDLDPSSQSTSGVGGFNVYGAGLLWFYRGIGVVCDRDGVTGYQDPNPSGDTLCINSKTATTDCILNAVVASQATWGPVNSSLTGNIGSVVIEDVAGVYTQACYVKGSVQADQTLNGVTLGDSNTKCDITINHIVSTDAWSNADGQSAFVTGCTDSTEKVAIQLYLASAGASTVAVPSGTDESLALGLATQMVWNPAVTCTYVDGTTSAGTATMASSVVSSTTVALPSGASSASTTSRINFEFSCPRVSASSSTLNKVYWDPDFQIDPSQVPSSAASLGLSVLLLVAMIALAL